MAFIFVHNLKESRELQEQVNEIRKRVLERMDVLNSSSDEEILELIWEEIRECGKVYSLKQRERLSKSVFHSLRKLDVLQELLED